MTGVVESAATASELPSELVGTAAAGAAAHSDAPPGLGQPGEQPSWATLVISRSLNSHSEGSMDGGSECVSPVSWPRLAFCHTRNMLLFHLTFAAG